MRFAILFLLSAFFATTLYPAPKAMEIYFIDVEGGQATLFVTPSGKSLLVDTGWSYNAYRDANRIAAAAKMAKVKKIDYVVITHYHVDHVGGVPQLVSKIPVGSFIDHGPNREDSNSTKHIVEEYEKAIGGGSQHRVGAPGETIDLKGAAVQIVTADGKAITSPIPGGGEANRACDGVQKKAEDPSENARSLGIAMQFGKFRVVDLGDLTWNKELELMCPNNPLGHADLLVVSHHGLDQSNSPALVYGLRPRIAVIDNGSKKGGTAAAWEVVHSSPQLEDIWQLHFANAGGQEHNAQDPYIANINEGEGDAGHYLKVTAHEDGSFEVYNSRNKFTKPYAAK